MSLVKTTIKKFPGALWLRDRLKQDGSYTQDRSPAFQFKRVPLDGGGTFRERSLGQIRNLLNYTKTSGSVYSADRYPAGYHTIEMFGQRLQGQRDPAKRLQMVPLDFEGKAVLDIGCNQGGMLFQLHNPRWAVGVDYDARMINAANRIKSLRNASNLNFYVLDLEKDPLELIEDFMPEPKADVVFLLSVCMWLSNWRQVIDYCASLADSMLFETNGSAELQESQVEYLTGLYAGDILALADRSDDDPGQKQRKLFYCGANRNAVALAESQAAPVQNFII